MASAAFGLVTHDDAQPISAAVDLEIHALLTCGELAEPVGEFKRALAHDRKTLALAMREDRDLPICRPTSPRYTWGTLSRFRPPRMKSLRPAAGKIQRWRLAPDHENGAALP
jgi:hypothetical protein